MKNVGFAISLYKRIWEERNKHIHGNAKEESATWTKGRGSSHSHLQKSTSAFFPVSKCKKSPIERSPQQKHNPPEKLDFNNHSPISCIESPLNTV